MVDERFARVACRDVQSVGRSEIRVFRSDPIIEGSEPKKNFIDFSRSQAKSPEFVVELVFGCLLGRSIGN